MPDIDSSHPRFSIIVAAYNVGAYIDQCLRSLLVERMRDCEVIVVNDGSTDDTLARIEAYTDDSRLVLIDKTNGGVSSARNAGIDAARGTFLMFVDGDDWVEPDLVECFDRELAETPSADLLVFGFYEVYDDRRMPVFSTANFWHMTNSPCNKLFHRHLFDEARFDHGIWYEDLAIVPYLFVKATAATTLQAVLYNYRRDREGSTMNSIDFRRIYDLPTAARRCLARIHDDERAGHITPMSKRFGDDWEDRFLTFEIFIPGILHRSRQIEDRRARKQYITQMMTRFPDRRCIRPGMVRRKYGLKMSAGSLLYRRGHDRAAHWLLHDSGVLKRRALSLVGLAR